MTSPTFLTLGGSGDVIVTVRFPTEAAARAWCAAVLREPEEPVQEEPRDPVTCIVPAPPPPPVALAAPKPPVRKEIRARRGLPVAREAALKPPLTGGPGSNARCAVQFSDDEDIDILEAGRRGEQALGAVAFAQGRSLLAVRRRYHELLDAVARELGDG